MLKYDSYYFQLREMGQTDTLKLFENILSSLTINLLVRTDIHQNEFRV